MIVGYLIYSDMTLIVGLLFLGFENRDYYWWFSWSRWERADGMANIEGQTHIWFTEITWFYSWGKTMEKKIDEGLIECVFAVHYGLLAWVKYFRQCEGGLAIDHPCSDSRSAEIKRWKPFTKQGGSRWSCLHPQSRHAQDMCQQDI